MDFLDPKKERWNQVKLMIGYGLVAIAIAIATLVLLYQAYGYSYDQGEVTQNGLVFVSSQPNGANIYLNGRPYKSQTNSRVVVPADKYQLRITKTGYRDWQRPVVVNGGDVQHFDYPFLFPTKLKTTTISQFDALPSFAAQSPDKRWLIMPESGKAGAFTEYDLKNPARPTSSEITLPDGSYTPGTTANVWALVEWSTDNRHVLLQHTYTIDATTTTEYVIVDRDTPVDSVDLTTALHLSQGQTVGLYNNRADQFYVYDQAAQTLRRVNGSDGSLVSQLDHILAFKTYGTDYLLYVTDKSPAGKTIADQVSVVLQAGQKTITLRTLPAGAPAYVLNLAQYSGDWYVAVGASSDTVTYLYKNPQDQKVEHDGDYPDPWRRLPVAHLAFLSFSSNTQFLLAESGQNFVVYDFENSVQYHYQVTQPLDVPQTHAVWMDGDRLLYVSSGKLQVFDYDYRNHQELSVASSAYLPFFAPDYSYLYALRAATDATPAGLTSTALTLQ